MAISFVARPLTGCDVGGSIEVDCERCMTSVEYEAWHSKESLTAGTSFLRASAHDNGSLHELLRKHWSLNVAVVWGQACIL